jgi:alpha-L-fucosidase 2
MRPLFRLGLALLVSVTAHAATYADLEYGRAGGESLRLDAGIPDGPGPFAAVILIHGGGWTGGDKSGGPKRAYIAPLHEPLRQAGLAWFSINYRLAPKHPYPAGLDDVLTAIRWVRAHAADYRIDPDRLALAGESAGAHLAALAAIRADGDARVAAVIPIYGRFDLTDQFQPGATPHANTAAFLGRTTRDETTLALAREASPLWHVRAGLPPFLLVHGTADTTVPYDQSVQLQARLRALGVPCDLLTINGGVHGMISWDKVAPTYQRDITAWIARRLQAETRP